MFTETVSIQTYITPWDSPLVETALDALLASATKTIRFSLYGATLPSLFDGFIAAAAKGVMVTGCFDHTQASGPTEAGQLHRLCLSVPPANFRVGTSPVGHQILHVKAIVVDSQFVWSGSWNASSSASKQFNNIDVIHSTARANAFEDAIKKVWDFITASEPAYSLIAA